MNNPLKRALTRLSALHASREQLEAQDEARSATKLGTVPINEIKPREHACVSGVLRAITYRPVQDKPVLVGRLFDGSASVDLIWLGRRSIAGIKPGVHVRASGVVAAGNMRPVIYNPSYELLEAVR